MPVDQESSSTIEPADAFKGGFVSGYLTHLVSYINSIARLKGRYADNDATRTVEYDSITDYWKAARSWDVRKPPQQYVALKGVISTYAPVLPCDPDGKRDIHRYMRRNYSRIQHALQQNDRVEGPTTLDAFMGFSAGQMVIRLHASEMPYVYMGLYHSIVRNSIPLFVERNYYYSVIEHAMQLPTPRVDTIEASIVGRLLPMPENFVMEFLRDINLYEYFREAPIEKLVPRFALQVDGENTMLQPQAQARYLDGDIWVAIQDGKEERVISRFLDLSNPEDIAMERGALKTEVGMYYGNAEVLSEYDTTDRIFPTHHLLDPTQLWGRESNGARVNTLPEEKQKIIYQVYAKEIKMSQDTINVTNYGGIVNVKSSLKNAQMKIEGATAMADAQKSELQALFKQLADAVAQVEKVKPEETARVAQTAELMASEVAKAKPDRSFLEITTKGLTEAAKALEAIAPPVISVVKAIVKLVLL